MSTGRILAVKRILLILLIILTIIFIWSNSLPDQKASKSTSLEVAEIVKPVLEPVVGSGNVTDHLVRKLAHFVEFGTLGFLMALFIISRRSVTLQAIINTLFCGIAAALTDETIQLFTGRGAQIQDVWLDLLGVASGLFVTLAVYKIGGWVMKKPKTPSGD